MALKKEVIDRVGNKTTYFRIGDIYENYINLEPVLTVYIIGYADETYRAKEKEELLTDKDAQTANFFMHITLPIDDAKGYTRQSMYARLKSEFPLLEGAEDIL